MQKVIFLAALTIATAMAKQPEPKRETSWKINDPGTLSVMHREKLFEDSKHRLDGTALVNRDLLNRKNPTEFGGRVDYNYKPARTNVGVEAVNAGRFGTQLGVETTRNIFKDRNSALDVGVKYEQHFGGPGGRGEPVFGGFVRGHF